MNNEKYDFEILHVALVHFAVCKLILREVFLKLWELQKK